MSGYAWRRIEIVGYNPTDVPTGCCHTVGTMTNKTGSGGTRKFIRGEQKVARTRDAVVERLAGRINTPEGDDLQGVSLEELLCGERGVADGVMCPDTMYEHLKRVGEKSRRSGTLKPGVVFARWLQEDDPVSYARWLELLAARAGRSIDGKLSFEEVRIQIGAYPALSRTSTTSSDLKGYERKLRSVARASPDMFLYPGIADNVETATLWSARYLETARHLTLLAGRARDVQADWVRAAETAETALRAFFDAVAASARQGQLSRLNTKLHPDRVVREGPRMPYLQVQRLAGEWAYALVRSGMATRKAVAAVHSVSPYFPVMPPADLDTWAVLARLDDPERDPIAELRWVPGYGQPFDVPPPERCDPLDPTPAQVWEGRALSRCWAAVSQRAGDHPQVQRLRELALLKLPANELWRYTLTEQLSNKPGMEWLLERAADRVSEALALVEPPNDAASLEQLDEDTIFDDEDVQLRPELLLGFDVAPQLPVMLLRALLDLDVRVRASFVILFDTLTTLKDGFAWTVLPSATRAAWGEALQDRRLKTAASSNPIPEVAALKTGVRRLRSAMAARTASINGASLSALQQTTNDLESLIAEVLPEDDGPWWVAGELGGTWAAGVLFPEPVMDTSNLERLGLVAVELPGLRVPPDKLKGALARVAKALGGSVIIDFRCIELGAGTPGARSRAEGTAVGSPPDALG